MKLKRGFCTSVTFGYFLFHYTSLTVIALVRTNITVSYFKFSYSLFSDDTEIVVIVGEYQEELKANGAVTVDFEPGREAQLPPAPLAVAQRVPFLR